MKNISLIILLSTLTGLAKANLHFDTNKIHVVSKELAVPQSAIDQYQLEFEQSEAIPPILSPLGIVEEVEVIFDSVVNVGEKVWNVIKRGIHDPKFRTARAHALPEGLSRTDVFHTLPSWKGPAVSRHQLIFYSDYIKNRWVAKMTYDVVAFYGGGPQGEYLLDVHVKPVGQPDVRFTWKLDVNVDINEPFNMSKTGTNPLAAMQVNVNYTAKAPHDHRNGVQSFLVKGDGTIRAF